jgi:maltooligosyltrehalose trehalohydrolase
LAKAVSEGRRAEYRSFGIEAAFRDPQDEQTFIRSRLHWNELAQPDHAGLFRLYRDLIRLRSRVPAFGNCRKDLTQCLHDETGRTLSMVRADDTASCCVVLANFAKERRVLRVPAAGRFRLELCTHAPAYWASPPDAGSMPEIVSGNTEIELAPESAVVYVGDEFV